ncbi:AI-2E family transporter [Lacticaseibacillus mingshuiensis]|uniref:AI-2E family transporter n=1 Tax=Lacticaseibacillus mingshuiensis TaxID=2799574 RepID=A0ABW4CIQ9_9LACO|nr:AI-2E family transporter [Lacticaseibacillus mingshuiensis]
MFEKLRRSKLLFWSLEALILVFLVIGLTNLSFLFAPIATFFSTLMVPLLTAGFMYYLFNPLITLLEKLHIRRGWGILLVFAVVVALAVFTIAAIIPNLITQITQLVAGLPDFVKFIRQELTQLSHYKWYQQFGIASMVANIKVDPAKILTSLLGNFSSGLPSVVGSVVGVVITLITIPVLLFYMLKDGDRFVPAVQKLLPARYGDEIAGVFHRMNATLSHYIAGQVIECLFVGTFTFIGYLIIGMPYAFLLGFFAGIVTLIPYIGPYIGIAPALLVAVTRSWTEVALTIVVVIIVQQVDGNVIYPNVIGRSLDIHPMTIIILLLVAGNLWGLLGTILVVPAYAVIKTVVTYALELYHFHQDQKRTAALTGTLPNSKPKP